MSRKIYSFVSVMMIILGAVPATAQLVNCEVFLKGNHLELGINTNGAFGSSAEAPSGYHANISDTLYDDCSPYFSPEVFQQLGFVADPNRTGWSSYYGDYIMPGNPREGWAIADDSGTATAYSYNYYTGSSGFTGSLTGGNVAYGTVGTLLTGTWAGTFHGTLNVNQLTKIDTGNLYLLVHVGFYNTSGTPDSFYYLRFINPHVEEVRTSVWNSKNKVEYQLPNADGLVVVSATGTTDTVAYMALGTADPRARCFISMDSTLPGPGSLASIWAMDSAHYKYHDTLTGNLAIGLVYKIGVGPGDSTFLDFGYSFKSSIIDTVLDTSLHSGGGGGGGSLATGILGANGRAVTMYPNPAASSVIFGGITDGTLIVVYDLMGRPVLYCTNPVINGKTELSVSDLPSGVYVACIAPPGGKTTRLPLVKQ